MQVSIQLCEKSVTVSIFKSKDYDYKCTITLYNQKYAFNYGGVLLPTTDPANILDSCSRWSKPLLLHRLNDLKRVIPDLPIPTEEDFKSLEPKPELGLWYKTEGGRWINVLGWPTELETLLEEMKTVPNSVLHINDDYYTWSCGEPND